jgi:protein-arginine kinase activator protein McsA
MQTKICTVCNVEKPATLEFFRVNITHKYGLYSKCKIREHFYVKEYRKNHIEKIRLWERNTRLRKKGLLPSRLKSSENQLERRRKYCKKYYFTFKKYKHTKMKLCVLGKMIRYNRGCKLKNNAPIDKLVGYDTITLSKHQS